MKKTDVSISGSEFEHLRQTNLGRLIDDLHFSFDQRALEYLRNSGYPMIKSADSHVMRTMRVEGSRITDMAKQTGISKQAMSKLVAAFAAHGFLSWADDPSDKRNRIVKVTEAGRTLLICGIDALRQAENDIAVIIGSEELEGFRELLLKVKNNTPKQTSSSSPQDRKRRI